jgi:hypothetical protein
MIKIGIVSLAVGEKFREDVKYGIRTKVKYCEKYGYDFIEDDSNTDHTRHLAWSKIPVILAYLEKYDYLVWMDADTIITNDDKKMEWFIREYMGDKELMYVESKQWVNTGVMFIKSTDYMREFMSESWNHTDKICWEQGAIDYLWRINWRNCRSKIMLVPDQRTFNSSWEQWRPSQFLVHFPGCGEPNRPVECLKRMMSMFCVLKKDDECYDEYIKRMDWLGNADKEIPVLESVCRRTQNVFPLDL